MNPPYTTMRSSRIREVKLDAVGGKSAPEALAKPGEEGQNVADLSGDGAFDGYWKRPYADMPDGRWGQKVVALVKAKGPVDAHAPDDYCRGSFLPDYKRPREYVFIKAVPKSPVGKILRRKLISGEYDKARNESRRPFAE